MDDFVIRAIAAGLLLTLITGPLGCFIVWRRLSYFGDTLAHAALLGVALSLLTGIASQITVFCVSACIAFLLSELERRRKLSSDALLGLMSHSALALGVVVIALMGPQLISLESLLFGDILLVSKGDLMTIASVAVLALALLGFYWRALIAATLSPELAAAEGLNPRRAQLILTLLLALVIAVSIKLVGALLITAMLILPATIARGVAGTPERMALIAIGVGAVSVLGGMAGAWFVDTPAGPSIVLAALVLFILSQLATRKKS